MWIVQLSIILLTILFGLRLKGVGIGLAGGAGLLILYFFFSIKPVNPPFEVALIIIAIVLVAAALDRVGALDFLTLRAASILAYYPSYITFVSSFVSYILVFFTGTGHVIYSLLPVINQTAKKYGVRPERPLVASIIASQQAIIATPFTGATAIIMTQLAAYGYGVGKVLICLIPASILGTFAAAWVASRQGKNINSSTVKSLPPLPSMNQDKKKKAQVSLMIFTLGIILIILLTAWQRSSFLQSPPTLSISSIIAMAMLSTATLILLVTRTSGSSIANSPLFRFGMEAVVALLGVAWMSNSFLAHHIQSIKEWIVHYHFTQEWQWALLFFMVTIISTSQSATLQIMLPLLLACVSLDKIAVMAILPAANSVYFIPTYPPIMTATALDTTGTTRTGRIIFDHSFLPAGVVGTVVTCVAGGCIQSWFF